MKIIAFTLEALVAFLFEKCNELYMRYCEVNLAKEKVARVQESLQSSWLCQVAGKGGVKL
ncbi:hypothetical protein A3F37_00835 [Candidatus Saccharibacteria bacterium RIFCSPHIGHO2_12_FULL_41_12]|nr:MAG: hypothetical protein A3F37_00835 [Candidatus Saccharibacteria bacterium RIFCSPHIGHO2_12_FULL_41_12]